MSFFLRVLGLDTKQPSDTKMPRITETPQESLHEVAPDGGPTPQTEPGSAIYGSGHDPSIVGTTCDTPNVDRAFAKVEKQSAAPLKLDAGEGVPVAGFTGLGIDSKFDPKRGFGWIEGKELTYRDRDIDDRLLGRFIVSTSDKPARLRITLKPGTYAVAILMGDCEFGNHVLRVASAAISGKLPDLTASAAEYAVLVAIAQPIDGVLDLTLTSPVSNWVVNAVQISPAFDTAVTEPKIIRRNFGDSYADIL